jgi:hypothetical protein
MSNSQRRFGSHARPTTKEAKEHKQDKPSRPAGAAAGGGSAAGAHPARLFSVPSLQSLIAAEIASDYLAEYVKTHKLIKRAELRKHLEKDPLTQSEPVIKEILNEFEIWQAKKNFRECILQNKLAEAEAF